MKEAALTGRLPFAQKRAPPPPIVEEVRPIYLYHINHNKATLFPLIFPLNDFPAIIRILQKALKILYFQYF